MLAPKGVQNMFACRILVQAGNAQYMKILGQKPLKAHAAVYIKPL